MCTCVHCRGHMADCGCHEDPAINNEEEQPQPQQLPEEEYVTYDALA
jgi:hypothetical protein